MSETKQTVASIINARIEALAGERSPQQIAAAAGIASERMLMLYRLEAARVSVFEGWIAASSMRPLAGLVLKRR